LKRVSVLDELRYRLLGPIAVTEEGVELELGAGRQRALLALLLVRRNEVVSLDRIVDELWGERAPATATKVIQGYVSQLRKVLGEGAISTRTPGYVLEAPPGDVDVDRFEELVDRARGEKPQSAAATLREALGLSRGPPLADMAYESFAQAEISRLEELRLAALEDRIDADLALGHAGRLVPELEALVREHPLRERLRYQLMLVLYRTGRQADALAAYADARRRLVEELGIEPGPELQGLQRRILAQDTDLGPVAGPTALAVAARHRWRLLAAGALLLAAAAVATVAVLSVAGREESAGLSSVVPNSVAVIDPRTNSVLGGIPVGASPSSIAVGEGAVWVLNGDDKTVSRIDPDLKKAVRTISVGGTPTDLGVGAGAVWVANGFDNTVTRIDTESNVVAETIRLPTAGELPPVSLGGGSHLAIGLGAVWVTRLLQHGFVWQIDPKTNAVAATIRLLPGAGGGEIAVGEDAVWVNGNGGVTRIDVRTHARTLLSAVEPGGIGGIAVGEGSVWVVGLSTGSEHEMLWRIDPRGELVTASISVGAGPAGVAVGGGSIWVANSRDGSVSRVDPATNTLARSIAVGGAPRGVAVGAGAVWVTAG